MQCNFHKVHLCCWHFWAHGCATSTRSIDCAAVAIASYVGCIWCFIICFRVSFQCNVLFFVSLLSLFFLCPPNSILSRTGKKESQDASNLTVPMTMCLFPVPFPLTPSLRPQVSSINPTVTRSLLYSVLRDAPSERGPQSRDAQLSDYPSLDYQGLYVTLVTLLDLVPLLQHGQHGEHLYWSLWKCPCVLMNIYDAEQAGLENVVTVINLLKGFVCLKPFWRWNLIMVLPFHSFHTVLMPRVVIQGFGSRRQWTGDGEYSGQLPSLISLLWRLLLRPQLRSWVWSFAPENVRGCVWRAGSNPWLILRVSGANQKFSPGLIFPGKTNAWFI